MNKYKKQKQQQPTYVANNDIRYKQVRVIGPENDKLGVMLTEEAKRRASMLDLDLVLVTDKADVPVCRIVDLNKHLYQQKQAIKEQNLTIPDDTKVRLIEKTGETEFRLMEGSNEHIQLEALLAQFVFEGNKLR